MYENICEVSEVECFRRGINLSVVCLSFSFSSREALPISLLSSDASTSNENSETVCAADQAGKSGVVWEEEVEGVLFLRRRGEGE
jgi:hypothetical protein